MVLYDLDSRAFEIQWRSIAGILCLFGRGWHAYKYEKRARFVETFGDSHTLQNYPIA